MHQRNWIWSRKTELLFQVEIWGVWSARAQDTAWIGHRLATKFSHNICRSSDAVIPDTHIPNAGTFTIPKKLIRKIAFPAESWITQVYPQNPGSTPSAYILIGQLMAESDSEPEPDVPWLAYTHLPLPIASCISCRQGRTASYIAIWMLAESKPDNRTNNQPLWYVCVCVWWTAYVYDVPSVYLACDVGPSLYRPVDLWVIIIGSWPCLLRVFDLIIMNSPLDNPGIALAAIVTNVRVILESMVQWADDGASPWAWGLSR